MHSKIDKTAKRHRKPSFKKVSVIVSFFLVVLFFVFGAKILYLADGFNRFVNAKLADRLQRKHGIIFLSSLDTTIPRDEISQTPFLYFDTPKTKGKFGFARSVSTKKNKSVLQSNTHVLSHPEMSYSIWIKPHDDSKIRQDIFIASKQNSGFTLYLENSSLNVDIFNNEGITTLSSPFQSSLAEYTHIAFTFSKKDAAVFINGEEANRCTISSPISIPPRRIDFSTEVHSPFKGSVDDISVFSKALSSKEIKKIASSHLSIKATYEPILSFAQIISSKTPSLLSGTYRVFDRLIPTTFTPALLNNNIPSVSLWMSSSDERFFKNNHEKSLVNGYRSSKAASFRKIGITFNDKNAKVEAALDDVYGKEILAKRPAFIIYDKDRKISKNSGFFRLYPCELHSVIHRDAPYPLPQNGFIVRLAIDNSFKGLYYIDYLDDTKSPWMVHGDHLPHEKYALYYNSATSPSDQPVTGISSPDLYRKNGKIARSDLLFPWSRQELSFQKKIRKRFLSDFSFSIQNKSISIPLSSILGKNQAAYYITEDLDLSSIGEIEMESSNTDVIQNDGKVNRSISKPQSVTISFKLNGNSFEKYNLRVMPSATTLPAVFIYAASPLKKHRRTDFTALIIDNGTKRWLTGTERSGSGIKHRGNTSYTKGAKRSMSLEFDEPTTWFGVTNSVNHALLYCGYADATRLRNKISYDSFMAAQSSSAPAYVPQIKWVEVFFNGEYFGIWETSLRPNDIYPKEDILYKVRAQNTFLFNCKSTHMTECIVSPSYCANPYQPLEELFDFTTNATDEELKTNLNTHFNRDSLINYFLILNFCENYDGIVNNQYIARSDIDKKWFIIPWDYDKTFFVQEINRNLINHLFLRILNADPSFSHELSLRWTQLRKTTMTNKAIFDRIESDANLLFPYMEEEYRLLQPLGEDGTFLEAVQQLKTSVSRRLEWMDTRYMAKPHEEEK